MCFKREIKTNRNPPCQSYPGNIVRSFSKKKETTFRRCFPKSLIGITQIPVTFIGEILLVKILLCTVFFSFLRLSTYFIFYFFIYLFPSRVFHLRGCESRIVQRITPDLRQLGHGLNFAFEIKFTVK